MAALFGAIFMLAGVTLDRLVYPDWMWELYINRMVTAILLVAFGLLVKIVSIPGLVKIVVHVVALLPLASISFMIYQTDGSLSPYYGGLNLILVGATLLLRWRTYDSIINALLCMFLYAFACRCHGDGWLSSFVPNYFIFVTGAITCAATFWHNQARFREFCLATEVAETNKRLESTNRKLRTIDETKSRFFANLSHELRTPLTLILGPAEHIRTSNKLEGDTRLESSLKTIEDNAYRLLRLINDILDLVKLDSGESPPRPDVINVDDFIDGLTTDLRPVAELKGIEISCHTNTVARKNIWQDSDRLEKIMLNLAVNALKFTQPGGSISIDADMSGDELHLKVVDTGEGMSEEDAANVFVRFWQADMSAKRQHRGAGIGLSLVKSLTKSMNGRVNVKSKLGEGTTFHVYVPAPEPPADADQQKYQKQKADVLEKFNEQAKYNVADSITVSAPVNPISKAEDQDEENEARGQQLAATEEKTHPGPALRKRVLIADDEEGVRRFIASQLSDYYDVIEAADGREAWDLALTQKPDLVIVDMMMPVLEGIEVIRKIRGETSIARTPVILITAQTIESPRLEALKAGANDFLSKPFSTVELSVRVRNLLDISGYEAQLADKNTKLEEAYQQIKSQQSLLVHTEKLTSLGRVSAGIAHEVNNPLNYTKIAIHTLKTFESQVKEDQQEDFMDILSDAEEGIARVIGIVNDLRSFARGDSGSMHSVNLAEVVESARKLVSSNLSNIELRLDVDTDICLEGNERQLCMLLVNFLHNSSRAIEIKAEQNEDFEGQGEIVINGKYDDEGRVTLSIRDNGCGIAAEDIEHIFEPFFTKNVVGKGMGLGLSICHSILEQHEATISVEAEVGEYTEFLMCFTKILKPGETQEV